MRLPEVQQQCQRDVGAICAKLVNLVTLVEQEFSIIIKQSITNSFDSLKYSQKNVKFALSPPKLSPATAFLGSLPIELK